MLPSESPLAEASPTSLDILMSTDPLNLTTSDVDRIVAELRAQRDRWEKVQRTQKKAAAKVIEGSISLEDLGL